MWLLFFICAIIATVVLMFHVTIEFNRIDKAVNDITEALRKHYEDQ